MNLMDKPFSHQEKDECLRMLDGNICRVCVSDDPVEVVRSLGFACDCISMLAYSRMLQLKEKGIVKEF